MQIFDGQLITVLGGGGFVGRYVVQRLHARASAKLMAVVVAAEGGGKMGQ